MAHAVEMITAPRKYPFASMRLADTSPLDSIKGRFTCPNCSRSRKFFCYNCYIPVGDVGELIPQVEIPVDIDIIKHKKEIDGKSSAVHAAVLSPERVHVYTYPEMPDYTKEDGVVLVFPSATSVTIAQLFGRKICSKDDDDCASASGNPVGTLLKQRVKLVEADEVECTTQYTYSNLPVRRAVFIDSTWNQSRGIYKDSRLKCLPTIVLQNRISQFWRHQRGSPRWYLATVEAIHQFLLEIHVNAWGLNSRYRGLDNLEICSEFYETVQVVDADTECVEREAPYNGQYDNLMFFFANMYDLIHKYYDHNELKAYRRPI